MLLEYVMIQIITKFEHFDGIVEKNLYYIYCYDYEFLAQFNSSKADISCICDLHKFLLIFFCATRSKYGKLGDSVINLDDDKVTAPSFILE